MRAKSDIAASDATAPERGVASHPAVIDMETTLASLRSVLEIAKLGENHAREVNIYLEALSNQLEALSELHAEVMPETLGKLAARTKHAAGVTTQKNQLVYRSEAMRNVVAMATRAAERGLTTLITGETGVGKELIARLIHLRGDRAGAVLVPFNCAALPKDLFESLLFGHKRGSFTGATHDQAGLIRAAAGGTLFLDEIGELPVDVQPKLLRFLQEGEIHPLGHPCPISIDTRIVASTNRRLQSEVLAGNFRPDLFYRLSVFVINIPPLRERRGDILALCDHFIETYASCRAIQLSPDAMDCLMEYGWPGNVRELSNIVQRLCALAEDGQTLSGDFVSKELCSSLETQKVQSPQGTHETISRLATIPQGLTLAAAVGMLERQQVWDTLNRHGGNFARAARELGLSTFGLRKKHLRLLAQEAKDATKQDNRQPD